MEGLLPRSEVSSGFVILFERYGSDFLDWACNLKRVLPDVRRAAATMDSISETEGVSQDSEKDGESRNAGAEKWLPRRFGV